MSVTFKDIEEILLKIPKQEGVNNNFYTFMHVASQIMLLAMHDLSSSNDVKTITLPDGSQAFSDENDIVKLSELLQAHGSKIKDLMSSLQTPTATKQSGGALNPEAITKLMDYAKSIYISPEELSFDHQYTKVTDYMDKLDEQNRELARQIGLVAFVSNTKVDPFVMVPIGGVPVKVQVPARLILPIINILLEVIRIFFAFMPFGTIPMQFFTLVQTLFDIARGEWKYGVFTFMGFFNGGLLVFGVFLKILRDVWLLIEPRLSKQIRMDIYLASKSIFIGFWLRLVTLFIPDFLRNTIDVALVPFQLMISQVNDKMEMIEEQVSKTTEPMGVIVKFPRIPQDSIPSLDDIQALQTVISQPEIFCADDFQKIIEPLKMIPPIRLLLELLNVPMDAEFIQQRCRGVKPNDLAGNLVERLMPTVQVIPGGPAAVAAEASKTAMDLASIDKLTEAAKEKFSQSKVGQGLEESLSQEALEKKATALLNDKAAALLKKKT